MLSVKRGCLVIASITIILRLIDVQLPKLFYVKVQTLNKNTLLLVVLSLVVVLVILLARQSTRPTNSENTSRTLTSTLSPANSSLSDQNSDRKLDAVLDGISQLNLGLNDLRERVSELEQSAGTDIEPAADEQVPLEDNSEVDFEANYSAFIMSLDTEFEALSDDISEQQQNAIQNLFLNRVDPTYQNVQVKDLECRGSSCRIELVLEGGVESEDLETEFMADAARLGLNRVRGYKKSESEQDSYVYFLSPPKQTNAMER